MSWSYYATGKPQAILAKIDEEFARYRCVEPEETMRQGVCAIIKTSLGAMPESSAVGIQASGSQSSAEGKHTNTLKLSIEPIYGFVE